MAQLPGFAPQVTDPALLNEIVDRLIMRGQLGELPVNPIVNLTYQISEGNWIRDQAIVSTTLTDPAVGAIAADTGPLAGGVYNLTWGFTARGTIIDFFVNAQFRNQANDFNKDFITIENDADQNSHRNFTRRKLLQNERLRFRNETDLTAAGGIVISFYTMWTRLF